MNLAQAVGPLELIVRVSQHAVQDVTALRDAKIKEEDQHTAKLGRWFELADGHHTFEHQARKGVHQGRTVSDVDVGRRLCRGGP